jgi:negative regulator of sigma-B (phosphoserine phosphatase)
VIEVGVATSALSGPSGDLAVVVRREGRDLVCAIDGLGHGYAAAEAARRAAEVLEAAGAFSLDVMLRRCHEALVGTRGAVMTLAEFRTDPEEVTWVGVGNVEARLLPAALALGDGAGPARAAGLAAPTLFGGVVGHHLPTVRPSSQPLAAGDLIVMVTDGVRADFVDGLSVAGEPQEIADRVLARASRGTDDALVLVVRWAAAAA